MIKYLNFYYHLLFLRQYKTANIYIFFITVYFFTTLNYYLLHLLLFYSSFAAGL
jgi:hypothetical protein